MIQVQGLTKFYGQRCAVRNVSFALDRGQVVGLLGLNGSGKTTILRMLAGDLEPSAGLVRVLDRDLRPTQSVSSGGRFPPRPCLFTPT